MLPTARARRWGQLAASVGLAALMAACGAPVGVKRADPRTVHRMLTQNVLTTGKPSGPTRNILYQRDLVRTFDEDPARALAALHAEAIADGSTDDLFALAELSFLHAERTRSRPHYLAAAVYAWAFLFPEDASAAPDPFDPRLRTAADLYNRGITAGFASADGKEVDLRSGTYALPFGALDLTVDPATLRWAGRGLTRFVPVAELEVRGLPTRFRWPGVGAPLGARTELIPGGPADDFVPQRVAVPVTALLRLNGAQAALAYGRLPATLEVYPAAGQQEVSVQGRPVPLENETTATLAYMLAESPVWKREITGFLRSMAPVNVKSQLAALEPYRPGRIPVVFVHGTASSAGRWAEMLNELQNDPRLREHYQFWFFTYDTGNPIAYSAMLLREALQQRLESLDPQHVDPALQQMVIIGHSQGGLLTKTMVVASGNRFWDNISRKPIEQLNLSHNSRDLLQRVAFFEPLPFVRRVIFVSTPQRGSYVAGSWIAHQAARLVTLPSNLMNVAGDLLMRNRDALAMASVGRLPTAVDSMTPGHPFVRTLASLPIAPGVHAHSIIAVTREGPPEGQNDGVVEYDSAHIDGVDSEFVVISGHSCQDNPNTIGEVRRILLLPLEETGLPPPPGQVSRKTGPEPPLQIALKPFSP